jgi:hypothetical protein
MPVPEDPRIAFSTPYRNVRPDVKYVGQEACARCHAQIAKTYRDHPMGRSLAPIQSALPVEQYNAAAKNPFDAQGFHYRIDRRDERVFHEESAADALGRPIFQTAVEVQYAIGSGTRGRTYLLDRDGYVFQSPVTWYPEKKSWDLSPGFDQLHNHFGRPVLTDCLFCHSNRVVEISDTQNHYQKPIFDGYAIGCERCHGPGELHVNRHDAGQSYDGVDDTIVNPGKLQFILRDAVCEQCHLQGITRVLRRGRSAFEFRPGLPLRSFLAVFVKPPTSSDPDKFVGQVEQMHASRCFQASNDAMGCIACHDPHYYPAVEERTTYYRKRCLNCHSEKSCSVPVAVRKESSKDDSCMQCHMPRGESDIQHHSITDHRIPRRANQPDGVEAGPVGRRDADLPMRLFHEHLLPRGDPEAARDLGIALVDRVERYPGPVRRELGRLALTRLDAALKADPGDVPAWDAKAHALWAIGDATGAAAAFDEALSQSPRREVTLQFAAALALERKRPDAAIPYLERALEVNPWRHEFHYLLAEAQAQRGDWLVTRRECQESLRLNPSAVPARLLLVECYLKAGQADEARAEFEHVLGLNPPNAEALRQWFAQRLR